MIIDLIGNKTPALTALSSAEASLYSGEAGEKEKESARGTMPWLIPYQVNNHSIHDFRIGIPSGSLREESALRGHVTNASFINNDLEFC